MAHNIDPVLLRAFVAVAETGGMTNAGRSLNLTQAAVSQQIKRLEDLFRQQLFERDRRQLRLTPRGERLLAHARRLLALNDEVWGVMTSPDFEGEVRLGAPYDVVRPFLPPILRAFDQAWPAVNVKLVCSVTQELLEDLERGDVDLTLTTEETCGAGGEVLLPDELVWVGAPGGRAHTLRPLPVSLGDRNCMFRRAAVRALADRGCAWRPVCEISNMEPLCATLKADLSVSPLLASTVPDDLVILGPDAGLPPLKTFYVNMYLPRANISDGAAELARHIRHHFTTRLQRAA